MSFPRAVAASSLVLALSASALAADAGVPAGPPGARGDILMALGHIEKQTVELEQAVPQAKFAWKPAKDVRSVAEVYLHVAGGIYFILGKMGREAPADVKALMESKKWEAQTIQKDEIKAILAKAFAFARKTVEEMSDADLDKTVDFFGPRSERLVFLGLISHCSEHLGQSIAYARMNGVVPPWSKPNAKD
jgi:uncharacterized damage-inducible protein DinB